MPKYLGQIHFRFRVPGSAGGLTLPKQQHSKIARGNQQNVSLSGPTLRVQVANNHILTQNLHYNSHYPKPEYLIIGHLDPLGYIP